MYFLCRIRARYGFEASGEFTKWSGLYGLESSNWSGEQLQLNASDHVVSVKMYTEIVEGQYTVVVGIEIDTSLGRNKLFGSRTNQSTVAVGEELLYVSGNYGGYIDQLQVHFNYCTLSAQVNVHSNCNRFSLMCQK